MSYRSYTQTDTIASGASTGSGIDLNNQHLVGIAMPASWTAAVLTFQHSIDGGATWQDCYDPYGAEISVTVAAGRYVALSPLLVTGPYKLRVRSGTGASAVNQAADRVLTFITHRYD